MNLIIIKYLLKVVLIGFGIQTVFVLSDKPVCSKNHEANKQWGNYKDSVHNIYNNINILYMTDL